MAEVGILKPTDDVELINGEIIQKMSPIKSIHADIVDVIAEQLFASLTGKAKIRIQNPIHINDNSQPEPDLAVAKLQSYRDNHPSPADIHLIIEVSDSTLHFDRTQKKKLYASAMIPEYWIVNVSDKQVEVYTLPEKSDYKEMNTFTASNVVAHSTLPFQINVNTLF